MLTLSNGNLIEEFSFATHFQVVLLTKPFEVAKTSPWNPIPSSIASTKSRFGTYCIGKLKTDDQLLPDPITERES